MEGNNPADESQIWAKTGAKVPQAKQRAEAATASTRNTDDTDATSINPSKGDAESANDRDTEGNGLEIDMDAPMDPIQIEAPESSENTSADKTQEKQKRLTLDDGFEAAEAKEKQKNSIGERTRDRSPHTRARNYTETTNSTNPKKIRSRVFVGQVNMEKCSKEGLEDFFSKCGTVLSVNIQNGYAFVQYDSEDSALMAIKGLNKKELWGREIAVCKPKAWVELDKEDARGAAGETRTQRALLEELEYLRRKEAERSRYDRYDRYRGYDRGYERGYDRYDHDRYHGYGYEMDRAGGDRYSYYSSRGGSATTGNPPAPSRGPSNYYGEDRYREAYYGGSGSSLPSGRSGPPGHYMGGAGGSGSGGGTPYYGGRSL